jgi:hypothetical protein
LYVFDCAPETGQQERETKKKKKNKAMDISSNAHHTTKGWLPTFRVMDART